MTAGYLITIVGMFFVIGGLFLIGISKTRSSMNWGALTAFNGLVIVVMGGAIIVANRVDTQPTLESGQPPVVDTSPPSEAGSQTWDVIWLDETGQPPQAAIVCSCECKND